VKHLPNILSLSRGVLGMILVFLVVSAHPFAHLLGLVIFIAAGLSDYYDGKIARRYGYVSNFGKLVDPITDKILILPALFVFSHMGYFNFFWIFLIAVREIIVTLARLGFMLEGETVAAEAGGKIKLVSQIVLLSACLVRLIADDYEILHWLGGLARIVILMSLPVTIGLTLFSGWRFYQSNQKLFSGKAFQKYVSALGVGLIPYAPGTWGSAVGLLLVLAFSQHPVLYLLCFGAVIWAGYWAVNGLQITEHEDPAYVVIDEAAGMMVSLAFIPLTLTSAVLGFVLFRLFDILKPPPLKRLERFPGYWGILCDDLGAGLYAWVAIQILI